ncbi:MAG: ribosome-associated translation inhibitor RaiA, partial [Gammaproteobacteria bacterium]|nr:ribosome-associated translation inhibitor RaiA [Gammaproteobacteria bacterium]
MQVNLTGHHVDITDALRAYVDEKIARLERHFDHVTNVHVILSVEKLSKKAEATVHIAGADVFADSTHEDMYAAID